MPILEDKKYNKLFDILIKGSLALAIFALVFFAVGRLARAATGTIDNTFKYAWGENIGWINFGCDNCDVEITDQGISGYAWSSQYGWINLSPTLEGVENDGTGVLGGFAWGSNIGWIDFSGVTIDGGGEFTGYATIPRDGSQINFNCANGNSCAAADFKVKTDWQPGIGGQQSGQGSSGSRRESSPESPSVPPPPPLSPPPAVPAPAPGTNVFNSLSEFFAFIFRPRNLPEEVAEVPDIAPFVFSGQWNLMPVREINAFVFAPLPYEIRVLAEKFPELDRTFQEVGIDRFSDLYKLVGVNLNIPGLTDILNTTIRNIGIGEIQEIERLSGVTLDLPGLSKGSGILPGSVGTGKIALISGLPIAKFSLSAKRNLPSEFVFARAAGELVDLDVALSVGESGEVTQVLSSLPGTMLKLVVKPLSAAKSVTGYIVFKASAPRISENEILRSSLAASVLFSMDGMVETIPDPIPVEKKLVLSSFAYTDPDHDGIYIADVMTPVVPGEYEVITVIDYVDPVLGSRRMSMITVIDPEGYIFEKNNGKETRIPGATVSLYSLDPATGKYELWKASDYQQENPQVTDVRGTYSFLVPEGSYYFHVEAPEYKTYEGKVFVVSVGNAIHENIELESLRTWPFRIDWQTILLIVVLLLLVYNLYRNNLRDKLSKSEQNGTA